MDTCSEGWGIPAPGVRTVVAAGELTEALTLGREVARKSEPRYGRRAGFTLGDNGLPRATGDGADHPSSLHLKLPGERKCALLQPLPLILARGGEIEFERHIGAVLHSEEAVLEYTELLSASGGDAVQRP